MTALLEGRNVNKRFGGGLFNPTFPISTLQGVPYSATELLDVAE